MTRLLNQRSDLAHAVAPPLSPSGILGRHFVLINSAAQRLAAQLPPAVDHVTRPAARCEAAMRERSEGPAAGPNRTRAKAAGGQLQPRVRTAAARIPHRADLDRSARAADPASEADRSNSEAARAAATAPANDESSGLLRRRPARKDDGASTQHRAPVRESERLEASAAGARESSCTFCNRPRPMRDFF